MNINLTELNDRVMAGCERKQKEVPSIIPTLPAPPASEAQPTFTLKWGASEGDNIETSDTEVLCIVAENQTNTVFQDLVVLQISMTYEDETAIEPLRGDLLPIHITPAEVVYFGHLEPGEVVVRKVMLLTRFAQPGPYLFHIDYHATIAFAQEAREAFPLMLVLDDPF